MGGSCIERGSSAAMLRLHGAVQQRQYSLPQQTIRPPARRDCRAM